MGVKVGFTACCGKGMASGTQTGGAPVDEKKAVIKPVGDKDFGHKPGPTPIGGPGI